MTIIRRMSFIDSLSVATFTLSPLKDSDISERLCVSKVRR